MVLEINEPFSTVIIVTDENNNPSTGKTINYRVFDESHGLFASGTMTEVGSYGIYIADWTPDTAGIWVFEAYYSGTDFKFYDAKSYMVQDGVEDAIEDRIKAIPSVDSIFWKSGGAVCPTAKSIWDSLGDGTVSLNTLNNLLTNGTYGLSALETLVDDVENLLNNATYGLSALNTDLDSIISYLTNVTYGLSALNTDLDSIISSLANAGYGLNALATAIAAVNTDLGDWSARTNLPSLLTSLGIPDTAGKPLYTVLVTDRLDNVTYGLNALDTDLNTIIANIGDFQARTNQRTILSALGLPDVAGKDLYTLLITDRLDHATFGLSALDTEIDAIENKIKATPSVTSIFANGTGFDICPTNKSIWNALGDGTVDINDLNNDLDNIILQIGNFQARTYQKSILAALGLPDVSGKDLYTVLVTDRLDNATYGLNALDTEIDAIENKIKATPSVNSIFANGVGFDVAPTNKSIWDALGDGTIDLNALNTLLTHGTYGLSALLAAITAVNTDLGDWSARTNLQSLLASLGIPDTAGKPLYTVLVTDRLDSATFGLSALNTDLDTLISDMNVPTADAVTNTLMRDVIGNKTDASYTTITTTKSLMAYLKAVLSGVINGSGTVLPSNKSLYDLIALDRLDHVTYGLSALNTDLDNVLATVNHVTYGNSALNTDLDTIIANIGNFQARTNQKTILAALGLPDVAGKDLYTVLVTDRLDSATYGLSALNTDLDSIISSLGNVTYGLSALNTDLDTLITRLGNPTGDTLTTITAKLGNNATAIGTVTDRLYALVQTTGAISGTPTVNYFTTNLAEATDDHYNGDYIIITSGALAGQAALIVDYDGTNKIITVDPAFIETPVAAATFVIVSHPLGALRTGSKGLEQVYDLVDQILKMFRVSESLTADGSEQTLYLNGAPSKIISPRKLHIDMTNMAAGDTVVLKEYYRVKSGGNYILKDTRTYTGDQSPDLLDMDLAPTRYGVKITLQQTSGTNRVFDWECFFDG